MIPNGVTSFVSTVFQHNKIIEEIEISSDIKKIPFCAFEECISLTKVTICEGVQTIEEGAFDNCPNLTKVIIPKSVTFIHGDAFIIEEKNKEKLTIYGEVGSEAETYAKENGFTFKDVAELDKDDAEPLVIEKITVENKKESKSEIKDDQIFESKVTIRVEDTLTGINKLDVNGIDVKAMIKKKVNKKDITNAKGVVIGKISNITSNSETAIQFVLTASKHGDFKISATDKSNNTVNKAFYMYAVKTGSYVKSAKEVKVVKDYGNVQGTVIFGNYMVVLKQTGSSNSVKKFCLDLYTHVATNNTWKYKKSKKFKVKNEIHANGLTYKDGYLYIATCKNYCIRIQFKNTNFGKTEKISINSNDIIAGAITYWKDGIFIIRGSKNSYGMFKLVTENNVTKFDKAYDCDVKLVCGYSTIQDIQTHGDFLFVATSYKDGSIIKKNQIVKYSIVKDENENENDNENENENDNVKYVLVPAKVSNVNNSKNATKFEIEGMGFYGDTEFFVTNEDKKDYIYRYYES